MTLASVRRINLLFDEVSSTSSSSSVDMCDHLNKCWTELLVGFGMSTSTDSEVFQVAFDMIATTKRERGVMTVVEADLLRNFFRNEAIKQINDLP